MFLAQKENEKSRVQLVKLGVLPYSEVRSLQEQMIRCKSAGLIPDTLIICEHFPVITAGLRSSAQELQDLRNSWKGPKVDWVKTRRGGRLTYHGPGQLLLYPVVSLSEHRIGLRQFVEQGLEAIARPIKSLGLNAVVSLDPAGVWVESISGSGVSRKRKKCSAVGLSIRRGLTDHGFSVNVCCDLKPYSFFTACGMSGAVVSSIERELAKGECDWAQIKESISTSFQLFLQQL